MDRAARRALALLAGTQFLLVLDTAIINVAAPSIGARFAVAPAALSWVANAYLVTFGGLLLLGGRAADRFTRRGLFAAGLGVLVVGSAAGAVAGGVGQLVAARAVQGVGAAIAAAAAFALLLALFPAGPGRDRALGVFAAMAGAGGAAGTVLGGVLTGWLGWRSTFALNVLAGLALAALAPRVLRPEAPRERTGGFDVGGALVGTAGLGLLAYALVNAGVDGWTGATTLVTGGLAVALLVAFAVTQTKVAHPLVPPAVIRRPMVRAANLLSGLGQVVLFPAFFLISVWMQDVLGYPPVLGGLGLLPLSLTVIAVASCAGRVIGRFGPRAVLVGGFGLVAVGLAWLSRISVDGSFVGDVLFPSLVLGIGLPLVAITTTAAATAEAAPGEVGLASGLVNTSQQFGSVVGLAVLSGIAAAVGGPADPDALTAGFSLAFLVSAGLALLGALSALSLRPNHWRTRNVS
ncbi:MFS transporter [Actinokineospora auranticolor]|uniref:EmrB/QacA subfamily drug resistance transporter n=1 Tax=Actinokineospora auranticolor TaxID=155976 RepID=A0A2S6GES8_9PSEU|nr:MFS transporter [Actinokineospora auranticolor]PPK63719.1 EmrB/QacA subfamily drug resistance transporter [Actinokineospora auranticolor]